MEGIIYNNRSQAEALLLRLNQRLKGKNLFKGVESSWSFIKDHPTTSKVAFIIDRAANHWTEIEAEITPLEINNITNLDASWHPNTEI